MWRNGSASCCCCCLPCVLSSPGTSPCACLKASPRPVQASVVHACTPTCINFCPHWPALHSRGTGSGTLLRGDKAIHNLRGIRTVLNARRRHSGTFRVRRTSLLGLIPIQPRQKSRGAVPPAEPVRVLLQAEVPGRLGVREQHGGQGKGPGNRAAASGHVVRVHLVHRTCVIPPRRQLLNGYIQAARAAVPQAAPAPARAAPLAAPLPHHTAVGARLQGIEPGNPAAGP